MKKKTTLFDLLNAEACRDNCLFGMAVFLEGGKFQQAMSLQFEYLYWCDVCQQLYAKHSKEWWRLRRIAVGGSL